MHRFPDGGREFYQALREEIGDYAERFFDLYKPDDQGKTKASKIREKIEKAERKGEREKADEMERELFVPPLSRELRRVWSSYMRMRDQTGSGLSGYEPLGFEGMRAFSFVTGVVLSPWEVTLIELIDKKLRYPEAEEESAESLNKAARIAGTTDIVSSKNAVGIKGIMSRFKRRKAQERKE